MWNDKQRNKLIKSNLNISPVVCVVGEQCSKTMRGKCCLCNPDQSGGMVAMVEIKPPMRPTFQLVGINPHHRMVENASHNPTWK